MAHVLVTGAAGYIGSVLCPTLLAAGHRVAALDSFRYGNHLSLAACCADPNFELVKGDARDYRLLRPLVEEVDVIIPLAALVGAPLCAAHPDEAMTVNQYAVQWIATSLSKDQLLIFSNTNSGYGTMRPGSNAPLTEDDELDPISLYGRTKCAAERHVLEHPNSVIFRLATVFGASPRMRTDLLANDFTLRAVRDGFVMIFDPNARRNFVNVRDVADAFVWAIESKIGTHLNIQTEWHPTRPLGEILKIPDSAVFNLGHDDANVTKRELAALINEHVPLRVAVGDGEDPDKRDYLVSNTRLRAAGFAPRRTLDDGIRELVKLYRAFPTTMWGNV